MGLYTLLKRSCPFCKKLPHRGHATSSFESAAVLISFFCFSVLLDFPRIFARSHASKIIMATTPIPRNISFILYRIGWMC